MTHSSGDTFGSIRSVLQGPASKEAWRALWALLQDVEEHELERTLVYVDALLARWPDGLRAYGRALLWAHADSRDVALQPICRTLDLSNLRDTLRYFVRKEGQEQPHIENTRQAFGHITRLDLSSSKESFSDIATFMERANMRSLREVDLSNSKRVHNDDSHEGLRAFSASLSNMKGHVALDLSKVGWANLERLEVLLRHADGRLVSMNLSQSRQDGRTLPALAVAVGNPLRRLDLSRNRIWQRHGMEALIASGILPQLEHLDLNRNDLHGALIAPIVSTLAPRIRTLGLTEVRNSSLIHDALSPHGLSFPHLESLAVDTMGLPPDLDAPALTRLELFPNGAADHDLSEHPVFGNLTHLTLRRGHDSASVEGILSRADLGRLRSLALDDVVLTDVGLRGLAANPTTAGLEYLRIASPSMYELSPYTFTTLLELDALRELEFERVHHGSGRLDQLLSSPLLPRLQTLSLLDCSLEDSTVAALFHNEALRRLETLRFRRTTKLSDASRELLVDPPYVPRHWKPSKHILELRADRTRLEPKKLEKPEES